MLLIVGGVQEILDVKNEAQFRQLPIQLLCPRLLSRNWKTQEHPTFALTNKRKLRQSKNLGLNANND